MSDVFISYSHHDREVAERIAQDLKRSGFSVLFDSELLVPGEQWSTRLTDAIRRAKSVLILLSPAYMLSRHAMRELELAAISESEGGARIVPVLIESTELPALLEDKQYADLRQNYEYGLTRVEKALLRRPESSGISRLLGAHRAVDLLSVLAALLSTAAGLAPTFIRAAASSTLLLVVLVAVGLTALVAVFSIYRPKRRSQPVERMTRAFEHAYVEALDQSALNPLRALGGPPRG